MLGCLSKPHQRGASPWDCYSRTLNEVLSYAKYASVQHTPTSHIPYPPRSAMLSDISRYHWFFE